MQRRLALVAPALLVGLAACTSGASGPRAVQTGPVQVPVPTSTAAPVLAACTRLAALLPATLPDDERQLARRPTPDTTRTAAWGDPAVTLECGVGLPADNGDAIQIIPPGSTEELAFDVKDVGSAQRYTTEDRMVNVAVTVPDGVDAQLLQPLGTVLLQALAKAQPAPGS